jgi:hypothetical protein
VADSPVVRNLCPVPRLSDVPRTTGRRPGRPDGPAHLVVLDDGAAETADGALDELEVFLGVIRPILTPP